MSGAQFDRDRMARWYAKEHLKSDPGVRAIYYLPTNAPEREIRFIEINDQISERADDSLEPIDFGVNRGEAEEHSLVVLDVTPDQWDRIEKSVLPLPEGWFLNDAVPYGVNGK